jgi:inner membrane protein involved in colicin E2 resistance
VPCLLAGIGNIIFYLLLLSLSEQIPFCAACLIAAAVTAMLTLYSRREPRSNSALAPSRRTM